MTNIQVHDVSTPIHISSFFAKRKCRLCNAELIVDDKSTQIDNEYSCTAKCAIDNDHYLIYIWWENSWIRTGSFAGGLAAKVPAIDLEICEFHINERTYTLRLTHGMTGQGRAFLKNKTDCIVQIKINHDYLDDEIELTVGYDLLNLDNFDPKKVASRIEKIRLLK